MEKGYLEINHDDILDLDIWYDELSYWEQGFKYMNNITLLDFYEIVIKLFNQYIEDRVKIEYKVSKYILNVLKTQMLNKDDIRILKECNTLTIKDLRTDIYDISDYVSNISGSDLNLFNDLVIDEYRISIGKVGYRDWTYYIAIVPVDDREQEEYMLNYIEDIYEGDNVYVINVYDLEGNLIDCMAEYIQNQKYFDDLITDLKITYPNLHYVINNNAWFEETTLPKVKKIKKVTYSFQNVID